MKAKNIRRLSIEIRKQYKIQTVDLISIRTVIEAYGYTIIEFDAFQNDGDVSTVIERLDLTDYIVSHKGFTYADAECRLVFVNKELDDLEKILILSHELGHITCNHLTHAPVLGTSVIEEDEANQFLHYLLRPGLPERIAINSTLYKKQIVLICCLLVIISGTIIGILYTQKQKSYYGDYYITSSGEKYHEAGCIFIKDKENVRRLTIEEFESGKYEPCQVCLPK